MGELYQDIAWTNQQEQRIFDIYLVGNWNWYLCVKFLQRGKLFGTFVSKFESSCLISLHISKMVLLSKAWIATAQAPNPLDHKNQALYKASLTDSIRNVAKCTHLSVPYHLLTPDQPVSPHTAAPFLLLLLPSVGTDLSLTSPKLR